jgi:heme-degrading monooxygenase HmoA
MPGFRGIEGFAGEDGSELAMAWFDSEEALSAWKQHRNTSPPRRADARTRFASYGITIADVTRRCEWPAEHEDHAVGA